MCWAGASHPSLCPPIPAPCLLPCSANPGSTLAPQHSAATPAGKQTAACCIHRFRSRPAARCPTRRQPTAAALQPLSGTHAAAASQGALECWRLSHRPAGAGPQGAAWRAVEGSGTNRFRTAASNIAGCRLTSTRSNNIRVPRQTGCQPPLDPTSASSPAVCTGAALGAWDRSGW